MPLQYETHPQRKMEMERQTRQWIKRLRPNRQYPFLGIIFFVVACLMAFALIKAPFDVEVVWDFFQWVAMVGVFFFMTVFFMCSEFYSTDIKISDEGLRVKRWVFGPERQYDWSEISEFKSQLLNNKLLMKNGSQIRVPYSGSFAESLVTAVSSFEARYLLDDESDE